MRRKLREALGTDLMAHEPGNKLWHTGNAVPLDGGDYRERKPWHFFYLLVQEGYVAGAGRDARSNKKWNLVVEQFLREQTFSM